MHLVETMAYAGERPWHGLGHKLAPQQPIDVWKREAGMDWSIEESEVRYVVGKNGIGAINAFPEQKVLYRSDTQAPLSVVSKRYKVVQPGEILEFYRDLTEVGGFELESAGVLREGRKFWALAKTGQSTVLKRRDRVDGYLLLATACDGTLATTAQFNLGPSGLQQHPVDRPGQQRRGREGAPPQPVQSGPGEAPARDHRLHLGLVRRPHEGAGRLPGGSGLGRWPASSGPDLSEPGRGGRSGQ